MAERILKGLLVKSGRTDIEVSSCAVLDMDGLPPDPIAVKLLQEYGFDAEGHTSKMITLDMIEQADLIAVMESFHKNALIDMHPESNGKIFLLKSFSPDSVGEDGDIKDPYRLSLYHYRLCFAEIYKAIKGLLTCI